MTITNNMYQSIRRILNFNTGWLFHKGDITNFTEPDAVDEKWENVIIPHTIQLEPKEWTESPSYQGVSYYQRSFILDPSCKGKKIFIRSQGVMINSEVWLNGKR